MKILTSLPQDKQFFDTYAPLSKKINGAGMFAQVVSGLTEIGIIYTSCNQALAPLSLGMWGMVISMIVAFIATAVIEIGLRYTFPSAVDSILFKRWKGLHAPISVFVWLLAIVLMTTSGLLSFKNSSVIVDNFTPEVQNETTVLADSIFQSERLVYASAFRQDSAMIETTYQGQILALNTSYENKIKAKQQRIRGYESREARSDKSYASRKDRIRQDIANLEAEQADSLSSLTLAKSGELIALKKANKKALESIKQQHTKSVDKVNANNDKAANERIASVESYGGGLGWFTVVCLFLFSVSVILDRIYRKGAGITETVQIESYDFRLSAWTELLAAYKERFNYLLHDRIKSFADTTPPAPLPAQPGAVFDLAEALQHVTVKLSVNEEEEEEEKVIYINTKDPTESEHRRIGFFTKKQKEEQTKASCDLYSTPNTGDKNTKHEPNEAYETTDIREAKQRLKMYKKRLGSHKQKAIKQKKDKGVVCKRTQDAIDNNQSWVTHWEEQVSKLS